jgi:transposase InsO family protein
MDATLATDVLNEALEKYPKPKIFNSDQGSQYTSKDGTYKKMWGEKEDNVVLLEILKKEMMSADRLYRELETQYKKQ